MRRIAWGSFFLGVVAVLVLTWVMKSRKKASA
jgi:hypothetical protein